MSALGRLSAGGLAAVTARRLAVLLATLLALSFVVYALLELAPGSAEQTLLSGQRRTPETVQAVRDRYHLDEPFLQRYGRWLGDAVRLEFGVSARTQRPVTAMIGERLPLTLQLGAGALLASLLLAVPLGMLAAVRQRSRLDRALVWLSVIGLSVPAFATGIVLIYVFGVAADLLPLYGAGEGFVDRVAHLALPVATLAIGTLAFLLKITRSAMVDVVDQDFMLFARARGLPRRRMLLAYALKNSLLPVITATGLTLGSLLTGAVITETVFALPGLGRLFVNAIGRQDIPVVQALVLLTGAAIIVINFLVDLAYGVVDPRVRLGRQ